MTFLQKKNKGKSGTTEIVPPLPRKKESKDYLYTMNEQTTAEFGFEPCRFRRHQPAGI